MHFNRDAAAIVPHRCRSVDVNGDVDLRAEARQMFVDRVIEYFKDTVMQPALVWVSDVHSRPLANRFQAFQLIYLCCAVTRNFRHTCETGLNDWRDLNNCFVRSSY